MYNYVLCHGCDCDGNYNEKKKIKGIEKEGEQERKQKVFRLLKDMILRYNENKQCWH